MGPIIPHTGDTEVTMILGTHPIPTTVMEDTTVATEVIMEDTMVATEDPTGADIATVTMTAAMVPPIITDEWITGIITGIRGHRMPVLETQRVPPL